MNKIIGVVLAVVMLGVSFACAKPIPVLTAEKIADNYAAFFSIQRDREDIENGTFTLYPWSKDVFEMDVEKLPSVQREEITRKNYPGPTELKVETRTQYSLDADLSPVMAREIREKQGNKTRIIRVNIQVISSPRYITKNSAEALDGMSANGGRHRLLVRVADLRNLNVRDSAYYIVGGGGRYFSPRYSLFSPSSVSMFRNPQSTVIDSLIDAHFSSYYEDGEGPETIFTLPVEILEVDGVRIVSVDPF